MSRRFGHRASAERRERLARRPAGWKVVHHHDSAHSPCGCVTHQWNIPAHEVAWACLLGAYHLVCLNCGARWTRAGSGESLVLGAWHPEIRAQLELRRR